MPTYQFFLVLKILNIKKLIKSDSQLSHQNSCELTLTQNCPQPEKALSQFLCSQDIKYEKTVLLAITCLIIKSRRYVATNLNFGQVLFDIKLANI